MIDLTELLASLQVQTNILNEKRRDNNGHTMRTADYNGFTCKAEGCFDKAEFFGSLTHFCESHMMIKVA
jgi:hypothetical protein